MPDAVTDVTEIARQLSGGGLAALPHDVLLDLMTSIRRELARREVQSMVETLRRHLAADGPDVEVRELVQVHGGAVSVLFTAEEWDTGHLLGADAEVTFEDGETENVDLRCVQPQILEVSAMHAPVGYAAEYRVNLRTGEDEFAPIGFGSPILPPRARDLGSE